MLMDNEFERNFIQNVKNDVSKQNLKTSKPNTPVFSAPAPTSSPTPLPANHFNNNTPKKQTNLSQIISLIAIIIVIIQSIIIVVLLINNSSLTNNTATSNENASNDIEVEEDKGSVSSETYIFDDNDNLIALNYKCVLDDDTYFILDKSNKISKWDAGSEVKTGNYSIFNNNLIQTSFTNDNGNVLYYDGIHLADGTTLYKCQEIVPESNV